MAKQTVLVVGLGEVGHALLELLEEKDNFIPYGLDIDETKMRITRQNSSKLPVKVDIMHICLPFKERDNFAASITSYEKRFKPELIIINSTVSPGTTKQAQQLCQCLVAHSPVRGVHKSPKHMKWELKRWTKYVGGANAKAAEAARNHFERMGLKVKTLKSCAETELAKLFETTYRAWMIICFQEMHRISRNFEAEFDEVVDFLKDTHRVRLDRPVMFPDVIGGHCLLPNTEILLNVYQSELLRIIVKSNEKRKKEVKDANIWKEVEKVRRRAKTFQEELMRKWKKQQ